ncbi:hypothetical protein Bca52824_007207 [Brassica carinata]|uniref:Seed maturation protein PM41 n=1 Tax=Brassica carinata TaxID=52824 RepID=A0A8X7W5V3_BRACI|nr:hypothetical protein Bca52824_007207 [Brassica carinata]
MSGAQGAKPMGSKTETTHESEDEGGIQVDKQQDKVTDAAGLGGPIFGAGKDDKKQDLGVTGTG